MVISRTLAAAFCCGFFLAAAICAPATAQTAPGATSIATVGTIAEIREASKYSDGRYDLLVVGTRRFRIESVAVGLWMEES